MKTGKEDGERGTDSIQMFELGMVSLLANGTYMYFRPRKLRCTS